MPPPPFRLPLLLWLLCALVRTAEANPIPPQRELPPPQRDLLAPEALRRGGTLDKLFEDGLYSPAVRAPDPVLRPLEQLVTGTAFLEGLEAQEQSQPRPDWPSPPSVQVSTNDAVQVLLRQLRRVKGLPPPESVAGDTGTAWTTRGNLLAGPSARLGTLDDLPLRLVAHGQVALSVEPTSLSPNLIGGSASNSVARTVVGAVIAGGGDWFFPNRVLGDFSVVGGGLGNQAGGAFVHLEAPFTTVGGGRNNLAERRHATVGGGLANRAAGISSGIAGGQFNAAPGDFAAIGGGQSNLAQTRHAVIAGGFTNRVSGRAGFVGGGEHNRALGAYAAVMGGLHNSAEGEQATVPGGSLNIAAGKNSFAAGHGAQALHDGAFVWSDRQADTLFASTAPGQFLVRAAGHVGIDDPAPIEKLTVAGSVAPTHAGRHDLGRADRPWRALHMAERIVFTDAAEWIAQGQPVLRSRPDGSVEIPAGLAAPVITFPDGSTQGTSATNLLAAAESRWAQALAAHTLNPPAAPDTPPSANAVELARRLQSLETEGLAGLRREAETQARRLGELATRLDALAAAEPRQAEAFAAQAAELSTLRAELRQLAEAATAPLSPGRLALSNAVTELRAQIGTLRREATEREDRSTTAAAERLHQRLQETETRLLGQWRLEQQATREGIDARAQAQHTRLDTLAAQVRALEETRTPAPPPLPLLGLTNTVAALRAELDHLKRDHDRQEEAWRAGQAKLEQTQATQAAATNALPALSAELQALRSEAQQQAAAWRAEVARLQQSLTAPSAATNALPSLNEELQALRSEAQQQAAAWRAEAERLQRALAAQATTAAGAPDVREEIRKEAAASAARLEGLSQQLAALRGRWEEQSNQVRRVEATVQEASARAAGESAAGLAALNQRLTEWRTDVDRRAGQADSATREMQAAVEGLRQAQAALRAQLESQPAPTESLPAARLAEWRTALEAQTTALRGMMEIRLRDLEGAEAELRDALSVLQRQPDLRPALDALNARVEGLERARRDPPPTVDAAALAGRFEPLGQNWRLRGNTDTLPGQDFLGTTDAAPLEFRVENRPALRLTAGAEAPNLIGGHAENAALQRNGVAIAGGGAPGQPNRATGNHAAIGGGLGNEAALMATVGGGAGNLATGVTSTIAGGYSNRASEAFASIGGGAQNIADGRFARIGGGALNRAPGTSATVGGGRENQASGEFSSVPGGRDNLASAPYAQAAGRRAKAIHPGSFVWADATDEDALSERPNHLLARATGGVTLRTAPGPSGVELPPGGNAWSMLSRRDAKENFAPADTEAILRKVGELPLAEWNLRSQPAAIRHLGPVAEDFHAAFGLGESADRIHAGDADGVALAAIQALLRRNERLERELAELRQQVQRLQETRP